MSAMRDYLKYGTPAAGAQGITAAQRQAAAQEYGADTAAAAAMHNAQVGADASMHNANVGADAARFGAAQATKRQGMEDQTRLTAAGMAAREQGADRTARERLAHIAGGYGLQEVDKRGQFGLEAEHVRGGYGLQETELRGDYGLKEARLLSQLKTGEPPLPENVVSPETARSTSAAPGTGGYGLPAASAGQPQAAKPSPSAYDKAAATQLAGAGTAFASPAGVVPDPAASAQAHTSDGLPGTLSAPQPADPGPSFSDRLRAGGGAMQDFLGETTRTPLFQALAPGGVRLAAQAPVSGFGLPDVAPGAQAATDRAVGTIQSRAAAGKIPNLTERLGGLAARGARYLVTPQDDEESRRVASR